MKIIFIHGRAQEEFEELALKQTWIDTLNEGLLKSGLYLPSNVKVEFPYYGKLLKGLVDDYIAEKEESTKSLAPITPEEMAETEFFQDFLTEMAQKSDLSAEEKADIIAIKEESSKGFLNWEPVQYVLEIMDKKQVLGEMAIKKFTYDVFLYLTLEKVRKAVNDKVVSCFDNEPCVVVGHSLGTIVSYMVLKNNPQWNVRKFITVGSPLGSASIFKYLEPPLGMPACVKNGWFNAFDERDVVSLNALDALHFNIDPTIENKSDVDNQTDNRHGIIGYLNDAVVAKKIYEALHL